MGAVKHRSAVLRAPGFVGGLPGVQESHRPPRGRLLIFAKRHFVPSTDALMIVDFCSLRRTKRGLKGLLIASAWVVIVSE